MLIKCSYCGGGVNAQRVTRRFCSTRCAQRSARGWPKTRSCRHCGGDFEVRERADANRQHCSKQCAKKHNSKTVQEWLTDNPTAMKTYNKHRVAKNPRVWQQKARSERERIIALLGGACVVCGTRTLYWLHVDFIPTTRASRFRHPRHYAYVSRHRKQFRVLCANHHYELTLAGRIEGTDLIQ